MVGMTRESINKQLQVWAKLKCLRLERGGIVVLAPDAAAEATASTAESVPGVGTTIRVRLPLTGD